MKFEIVDYTTRQYNNNTVYVIKKEKASNYIELKVGADKIVGAYFNLEEDIIGINTLTNDDIYSPKKLTELINDEISSPTPNVVYVDKEHYTNALTWWNEDVDVGKVQSEEFEDVEIRADKLNEYFVERKSDFENGVPLRRTYYLNPHLISGIGVKIGKDTKIDYDFFNVCEITLYENKGNKYNKMIYLAGKGYNWLQDIDINTKVQWEDIFFVFEKSDLDNVTTIDTERQLYIELHNNLDPYGDVGECDRVVEDWLVLRDLQKKSKTMK